LSGRSWFDAAADLGPKPFRQGESWAENCKICKPQSVHISKCEKLKNMNAASAYGKTHLASCTGGELPISRDGKTKL
jgi:hypothetical protein